MYNLKSTWISTLIIIIFLFTSERTSSATQHDFQSWFNLIVTGHINKQDNALKNVKYWLEGQERMSNNMTHFSQALTRIGLGYAVRPNLSLWVGYAWIRTVPPFTAIPFHEDRIWEQLVWNPQTQHFLITSRTRLEQRFLANQMTYRVRQLIKVVKPLKERPQWSLVASDEGFWHLTHEQRFSQNRFFIGVGYQLNETTKIEIGYMNQYIPAFDAPHFMANCLSFNVNVDV